MSPKLPKSLSLVPLLILTACGEGIQETQELVPEQNDAEQLAMQEQEVSWRIVFARGPFVVFDNPYGDGSPNPAAGIEGYAGAVYTWSRSTYVSIRVRGLPADRVFGAHVHRLACADTKGGTHYQNMISPTTPTDPAYANPTNEIWLDFTSNAEGRGFSWARAGFHLRPTEAKSIVIHTQATGPGGVAGAKLACIDVPF